MTHHVKVWNDLNCGSNYKVVRNTPITTDVSEQAYLLSPNPNSGRFTLSEKYMENQSLRVRVFNAIGVTIYDKMQIFENGNTALSIGKESARVYLLQLTDIVGKQFFITFVKE